MSLENTHKLMGFYMEGLILGVNTMYMLFCFFKLFLVECIVNISLSNPCRYGSDKATIPSWTWGAFAALQVLFSLYLSSKVNRCWLNTTAYNWCLLQVHVGMHWVYIWDIWFWLYTVKISYTLQLQIFVAQNICRSGSENISCAPTHKHTHGKIPPAYI